MQIGHLRAASLRRMIRGRLSAMIRVPSLKLRSHVVSDREIGINRVVILGLSTLNFIYAYFKGVVEVEAITISLAYWLFAIGFLVWIRRRSDYSERVSFVMLFLDVGMLTCLFVVVGSLATLYILLYLWIAVGYGFRYGIYHLRLAILVTLIGFSVTVWSSPHLQIDTYLLIGLYAVFLLIPTYIELLLRQQLEATERANDANSAKNLMLASLSHEIREPLGAIVKANRLLAGTKLDFVQQDLVTTVQSKAQELLAELDDVLEVSRLDAGRTAVAVSTFAPIDLVQDVVSAASVEASSKSIQVSWHVSPSVPSLVTTDRRHVSKILGNVTSNAVKFTSVGAVLISISGTHADGQQVTLHVEVSDTGIGIEHSAREHIFESFVQARSDVLHRYGGYGLGLSVAKRLVEFLGGRIGVESRVGKGSCFWIDVPVIDASSTSAAVQPLDRVCVVILTSRPESLRSFAKRIGNLGAQVVITGQADELVAAVEQHSDDADQFSILVDGRDTDAVGVALSLRIGAVLGRTPLMLLSTKGGFPSLDARRHFATSIHLESSDRDIAAALRIMLGNHAIPSYSDSEPGYLATSGVSREAKVKSYQPDAGRSLDVLIADSSTANQMVLRRIVTDAGHRTKAVSNGDDALTAIKRQRFDVVLMSTEMPVIDGYDATKMLRIITLSEPYLPVIGLVPALTEAAKAKCQEAGMENCIQLPSEPATLLTAIAEVVPAREIAAASIPVLEGTGGRIEVLSSHPRYRPGLGPAVTDGTFSYLESLGGPAFVLEVGQAFLSDAAYASEDLRAAVSEGDFRRFRTQLHALRSSASNVGAQRLESLCMSGVELDAEALRGRGDEFLRQLRAEIGRVRAELDRHR